MAGTRAVAANFAFIAPNPPGGAVRQKIDVGAALAALGAVALVISLFLNWYGPRPLLTAFDAFEVVDWALAALALVALVGLGRAIRDAAPTPGWLPAVVLGAAFLVAAEVIDPPPLAHGATLELEGTFPGGAGREHERARLLVENAERSLELSPITTAALRDGTWRATYALALGHMQGATYALAVGRTLLLDLPVPDLDAPSGAAAQHVRLARETNELRARLDEALAAREEAGERAGTAADELATERAERTDIEKARDRALSEAGSEKEARERAEAAVAEARRTTDEQLAAARADKDKALEAVREEAAARL